MTEQSIQDSILRTAIQLQRLSANEEAHAEALLRELETELRQLLASRTLSEAGKREIEALIKSADEAIAGRYDTIANALDTHQLVVTVAEQTAEAMQSISPQVMVPTAARLASLSKEVLIDGAPTSAWWAKQAEDTAFKFAAQVRQGIINGETQERIVARIVGKPGQPGIMDTVRRNVRVLVHSSVMSAANQARLETYRKNARFIGGIRHLSTLDSHTCMVCMAYDGAQWDLDGKPINGTKVAFQASPIHVSCRCVDSPIPKGLDALGFKGMDAAIAKASMRASKNGPIAGNTTFNDFLARQTPAFIENALGKKRTALFLAGKITVKDLVSGTGRPLTLDQLRAH